MTRQQAQRLTIAMKNALFFCVCVSIAGVALAEHNETHQCNYSIPGYALERYQANDDGTVLDTTTGLTWNRCTLGMSWDSELNACLGYPQQENWKTTLQSVSLFNEEQTALALPSDWRLPNIKELASIVNLHCVSPALDTEIFPDSSSSYWSSTPFFSQQVQSLVDGVVIDEHAAWSINFALAGRESGLGISQKSAARLVRIATE